MPQRPQSHEMLCLVPHGSALKCFIFNRGKETVLPEKGGDLFLEEHDTPQSSTVSVRGSVWENFYKLPAERFYTVWFDIPPCKSRRSLEHRKKKVGWVKFDSWQTLPFLPLWFSLDIFLRSPCSRRWMHLKKSQRPMEWWSFGMTELPLDFEMLPMFGSLASSHNMVIFEDFWTPNCEALKPAMLAFQFLHFWRKFFHCSLPVSLRLSLAMASFPIGISAWCRLVSSERAVCSELGACEHPKDPWLFISQWTSWWYKQATWIWTGGTIWVWWV